MNGFGVVANDMPAPNFMKIHSALLVLYAHRKMAV
jgi:hypothetical protein